MTLPNFDKGLFPNGAVVSRAFAPPRIEAQLIRQRMRIVRLHRDEAGMMSLANVVAALVCVVLMGLVANVGQIVRQKVELQNAADAAAITDATWRARGMNAVTMTNHVMGELNAFVVMHYALGGENVGDTPPAWDHLRVSFANLKLMFSYWTAIVDLKLFGGGFAYDTVNQDVKAEATELESKLVLKSWLAFDYMLYNGIPVAYYFGGKEAGDGLKGLCQALEWKIQQEYKELDLIHTLAVSLKGAIWALRHGVLPAAKVYQGVLVQLTPLVAQNAAQSVSTMNGASATVFPPPVPVLFPLPVTSEPVSQGTNIATTQLARATFPWVSYHRKPILDFFLFTLTLSGAHGFYLQFTHDYTLSVCQEIQTQDGLTLYVMDADDGPDKGSESWTHNPEEVDRRFTVLAFTYRQPPPVVSSPAVYAQEQPNGMATYAQAIFYNANDQDPGADTGSPQRQPYIGWDTLNWDDKPESPASRPLEVCTGDPDDSMPQIKLNWQAKLVPVSPRRLEFAALYGTLDPKLRPFFLANEVASRALPNTH